SYRLGVRGAKHPGRIRRLYFKRLGAILLFLRTLEGNFLYPSPDALWRNAAGRAAPPPARVVKFCPACQKNGQPDPHLMLQPASTSIESRSSWTVATMALVTMLMAFGAAWITAVALKDIAAEVGGIRSIPALASALAWLGSGMGGIMMGWIADKVGTRWTVICGALMIGVGLAISTLG